MASTLAPADSLWLPRGDHWDLRIEHKQLPDAGAFTGGGWKLVWHITVSPWETVDSMWRVLRDKDAAPHFVIGGRKGVQHPVVIQCIPLDRAGRALAHPSGPETNRANAVQVEICATPETVKAFTDWTYKALGNLAELVAHRVDIPCKAPRAFTNTQRFTPSGFVRVKGHCGHMHVPGNDHVDPTTAFQGASLCKFIQSAPNKL